MNSLPKDELAPCIVVAGPKNSGKSTILNLLNEALRERSEMPLALVLAGNPDGSTGQYLYYSRPLRKELEWRIKGSWLPTTYRTICSWIENARAHLELVLLDFGGKRKDVEHANREMLKRCSHYIVVRRPLKPGEDLEEDADRWIGDCNEARLEPIAILDSIIDNGRCTVEPDSAGVLRGAFRSDASTPGDFSNAPLIDALAEALVQIRSKRPVSYIDLRLDRLWEPRDLATVGGLLPKIQATAKTQPEILLGGSAPEWAYAAAMHRALDCNPGIVVRVFYPMSTTGFVTIPDALAQPGFDFPKGAVSVAWTKNSRSGSHELDIRIDTEDRFLTAPVIEALPGAPLPDPTIPPAKRIVGTGRLPIWLHLAYSRWLRSTGSVESIGLWDGTFTSDITVHTRTATRGVG